MSNAPDSDDAADSGGFDDYDLTDTTSVEDFTGGVIAQFGRHVVGVAQHLGRFGDSLGGLAIDVGSHGDPRQYAEALRTAHACGQNVARYLREALEHVRAANELIGKAASRARSQVPPAPR